MKGQSDQLERESEGTRTRLGEILDELRLRLTPGQVVDQFADYAREGPAADFLRNLSREIRENPLPLLLIAAGIGWLAFATSRRPQMSAAGRDLEMRSAVEIDPRTAAVLEEAPEQDVRELGPVGG
jgi:Protein of unknown function (DUF3618)